MGSPSPASTAFLQAFRLDVPSFRPWSRQIFRSMSSTSLLLRPYLNPSSRSRCTWCVRTARTMLPYEPQDLRKGCPCWMAKSLILPLMSSLSRWLAAPHLSQVALRWHLSPLSWAILLHLACCALVNPLAGDGGFVNHSLWRYGSGVGLITEQQEVLQNRSQTNR